MSKKTDDALLNMLGEIQSTDNVDHARLILANMLDLVGLDPSLAKEAGKPQNGARQPFLDRNGKPLNGFRGRD